MTTLDRLYKKGLLERTQDDGGRAFRYRPKLTQEEFYRAVLGSGIDRLLASDFHPALPVSFLVDKITEHDTALLDELARAVERKRSALRKARKA